MKLNSVVKLILVGFLWVSFNVSASDESFPSAQEQSINHLLRIFSNTQNPTIITQANDLIFRNYLQFLRAFPASEANQIAQIANLGVEYYQSKLVGADPQTQEVINFELWKLLRGTKDYFVKNHHDFNTKYFYRLYERQDNVVHPQNFDPKFNDVPEMTINEKEAQEVLQKIQNAVTGFITDAKYRRVMTSKPIQYENTHLQLVAYDYTPRTDRTEGNIVVLGQKLPREMIYQVKILEPDAHTNEALVKFVNELLKRPEVYGVFFEDRFKIPSQIDRENLDISNIPGGRILLRSKTLICQNFFS